MRVPEVGDDGRDVIWATPLIGPVDQRPTRLCGAGFLSEQVADFLVRHEPGNPIADAKGDVKYPNINALIEMTDLRDAQRSYEANLNIITATRRMLQRTLDILKG